MESEYFYKTRCKHCFKLFTVQGKGQKKKGITICGECFELQKKKTRIFIYIFVSLFLVIEILCIFLKLKILSIVLCFLAAFFLFFWLFLKVQGKKIYTE